MKLITGFILVFLVGCASAPDKEVTHAPLTVEKNSNELALPSEHATSISSDVLYLLLTAEIAGQRNQYNVALDAYLQAAKHVDDPRIAERAAKIGFFIKNSKKTNEAVSLWLKHDEKNLTARKIAVFTAFRETDKDTAVEHLNSILKNDPASFESTLLELTKALGNEVSPEFVFEVLETISEQHQDNASVFLVQSLLAGRLQKLDLAKQKIAQAISIQPEWDKALILQAQFAAQSGEFGVARELLEKVLNKAPDNRRVRKMLAQILIKNEAYDEALQLYKNILENKPEDGDSQFAIALILIQQKKEDEALEYFKNLVNKPAWDAQASFYIGRIEYKNEHYDKALVWFDKVTKGPYTYDSSMAAVSVLLNQKNYLEAENRLEALSGKYPSKHINIQLLKAEFYNDQKKYQKAFEVLSDVLKDSPEHRDLLYTRALIAEKLNKLTIVEEDLKKIISLDPNDASALNALGYTLVDRTDRYEEAEKYLLQAIKIQPEEAVIIDSLGWLQFKLGNTEEALNYLRDAYKKQPESEIAAHLAEVLWVQGKKTEAIEIYQRALKKSPDDEYLLKFKQRFLDQQF